MIVARTQDEEDELSAILHAGQANGARDLALIGREKLRALEPRVKAVAAIHSPHTGIIDAHGLMRQLHYEAQAGGAVFSFGSRVAAIEHSPDGYIVTVEPEHYRFTTEILINAAGLHADRIAALAGVDIDTAEYRIHFWKGSYFSYAKPSPVRHLIYPLPHAGLTGLGIHATLDLGGRLRFGPDAEPVDAPDYRVDSGKRERFFHAAESLIDGLEQDSFAPDMAGVRPKLGGQDVRDFIIRHEAIAAARTHQSGRHRVAGTHLLSGHCQHGRTDGPAYVTLTARGRSVIHRGDHIFSAFSTAKPDLSQESGQRAFCYRRPRPAPI